MLTLNFKSYYKTVCYEDQLVLYIVTVVYWNIVYIESCMYKSVLGKINKLQKKKSRQSNYNYKCRCLLLPVFIHVFCQIH
jgi:hypothetical protein